MRATAGLGGWKSAARRQRGSGPESAPQAPPAPCALELRLQASQTSDRLPGSPPPRPPRFDVCRGLPGAPGIGWQSRLSGAAAVTLRLGLRAGRKQACVEFLFDPHGGINRKRRAPKPKGPALAFVVGSAIYRLKEVSRDPCPVCPLGTAGGGPCEYAAGRQQALCAFTSCRATESICLFVFKLFSFFLPSFVLLFLIEEFSVCRGFRTTGTRGGWASFQEPTPGASVPGYLERHLLGQSGQ